MYNKPPTSYDSIISMTNVSSNQQLLHKHEKLIQEKKLDRMAIHIFKGEQKLHECENRFNDELSSMWQNHRNLVKDKEMPIALSNLIQQRFTNITDRWRDEHSFRIEYYLENPYGDWDTIENNRKNTTMETVNNEQIIKSIGFQPSMIIDTKHSLNDKQLKLLYRGPTYVSPCQIHISSLCQSTDDALKQQYAPLKHQLAWLVEKYKMDVSLHFRIQNEFYDKFKECFSMTLSPYIEKRARYEMNSVQTIRQSIKTQNLILLRTADNMNTFYLGDSQDFQLKADDCFAKTDNHQVFFTIDEQKNEKQQLKKEIYKLNASISNALRILRRRNEIDENLYNRLVLYQAKIKLSYLYFLPHVSKVK